MHDLEDRGYIVTGAARVSARGATIAGLLSDDTSHVTGQILAVGGGMVIR
ncbi:hypothetical protein ACFWPH_20730 [Nocardia sp. NPDC058499]